MNNLQLKEIPSCYRCGWLIQAPLVGSEGICKSCRDIQLSDLMDRLMQEEDNQTPQPK